MLLLDQRIRVVRSVRTFGSQADSAEAGMCVAVSLSQKTKCERGTILCDPSDPPRMSDSLICRVFWMNRQALAHGEHIKVCIATQETRARVAHIADSFHTHTPDRCKKPAGQLRLGEIGAVALQTETPIAFEQFSEGNTLGRMVLVRDGCVCGAGVIFYRNDSIGIMKCHYAKRNEKLI